MVEDAAPRGGRLPTPLYQTAQSCFNPRPRAGGDTMDVEKHRYYLVSIHAPARGATGGGKNLAPGAAVSIHAPARGATEGAAG